MSDAQTVYVSRMWHNHQPNYWPDWNTNGGQTNRVEYAWDSIVSKPNRSYPGSLAQNPENNLSDIFGIDDRKNSYQSGPRNALANLNSSAGFCLSYSGSLMDGVRSLAGANQLGYGSSWNSGNKEARNWLTPSGSRRLDLVGFNYHHSLGPLLPKNVLRKELQIFKQAYWKAWGANSNLSDHSKGYFPTEMAFSESMIDVLAEEGYQWSIVASHHLSRTCPTYMSQGSIANNRGIFSSLPNKADLLGPSPSVGWWYGQPNPGNAAWNVSPFAYQLHKAKYVNPNNGQESSLFLVPSDDVLSYRFGYAAEGIGQIQSSIAPFATDPVHPVMVMPSSDGDNAWGGGSSSWFEATPAFFNAAGSAGYGQSAVQDFVNRNGAAADTVHVEDGAWIFPESCYGSANFLKWIEPPLAASAATRYANTMADLETPGFALKFWSWAPVITGANWCETAEQIWRDEASGNTVEAWKIQAPYDWNGTWTAPNDVELAWHIYLYGLDSGFNYYGGLGNDDEIKAALATTRAIQKLQPWMTTARRNNDRTPPTVLKPQRYPYNPGTWNFGWFNRNPPTDNSYQKLMPSDFYVWTHAYDISGIASLQLRVRLDNDGTNSMASNQNETYAGGSEVGSWISVPMTKRVLPNTKAALNAAANNSQINYFITPPELADYYFAKVTNANLPNFRGKLVDYYVEATDNKNNVTKSEIQHVFVEDDGNPNPIDPNPPSPIVATTPAAPSDCASVTITYDPTGRNLANASPVYIHIGRNGWLNRVIPRPLMTLVGTKWEYTYNPLPGTTAIDVDFTSAPENGTGVWDNNGGADWHIATTACAVTSAPAVPSNLIATVTSPSIISLDWADTTGATFYSVRRGGTEVATTTESNWFDIGRAAGTTYTYTVTASNGIGPSAETSSVQATTPPANGGLPTPIPFVMDGVADFPGYQLSNPGMTIYAAMRGNILYVATWAPGAAGNDHFIMVGGAVLGSATTIAPWAKAGTISTPVGSPFLASESTGSYIGWFNAGQAVTTTARAAGQQMEGTIDLATAFPAMPTNLYIAALAYQTTDDGLLGSQAPTKVIDNGDVEPDELLGMPLEALRDEDANGIYDRLEPGKGFVITQSARTAGIFTINWKCFPGRSYKIQSSANLITGSWTDVPGVLVIAGAADLNVSHDLILTPLDTKRFFRVMLVP
ncbi:MAG: hypothetical protein ABI600_08405 [Luteolibacter sp.]